MTKVLSFRGHWGETPPPHRHIPDVKKEKFYLSFKQGLERDFDWMIYF